MLRTVRGWVFEHRPDTDAIVLSELGTEPGGARWASDVLRTLRQSEVARLTELVESRLVGAVRLQRAWRRTVVRVRLRERQAAAVRVAVVSGLVAVDLSRQLAVTPAIVLHLEDRTHRLQELTGGLPGEAGSGGGGEELMMGGDDGHSWIGATQIRGPSSAKYLHGTERMSSHQRTLATAVDCAVDGERASDLDPALALGLATELAGLAHHTLPLSLALRSDLARGKVAALSRGVSALDRQTETAMAAFGDRLGAMESRDVWRGEGLVARCRRLEAQEQHRKLAAFQLAELRKEMDLKLREVPLDRAHHSLKWNR
jgi:hypothetical protein